MLGTVLGPTDEETANSVRSMSKVTAGGSGQLP